jgi:fucose 4-O-acetylase-like acetyltransferase
LGTARSQRNLLVDALKFLAIAMVPAQHLLSLRSEFMHVPGASWLVAVMLSFDMPLFTFLSGYVLPGREGTSPLSFIRSKALVLLVPYLAWIAVVMPLRHVPPSGWLPRLAAALVNPHHGFQMWYLWVLFALFVVFTLARAVSTADAWTVAVAVVVGALLLLPLPQTLGADKIAWLYPFLVLGYMCGKHREALRRYDAWIAVAGIAVFAVLTALGSTAAPARFAVGVGGIVTSWAVYRLLPAGLIRGQAWVGQKTLGIYGAQMLVLPYVMVGSGWPGAIASEITVMTAATLVAWGLSLNKVTRAVFLGQWPKRTP